MVAGREQLMQANAISMLRSHSSFPHFTSLKLSQASGLTQCSTSIVPDREGGRAGGRKQIAGQRTANREEREGEERDI